MWLNYTFSHQTTINFIWLHVSLSTVNFTSQYMPLCIRSLLQQAELQIFTCAAISAQISRWTMLSLRISDFKATLQHMRHGSYTLQYLGIKWGTQFLSVSDKCVQIAHFGWIKNSTEINMVFLFHGCKTSTACYIKATDTFFFYWVTKWATWRCQFGLSEIVTSASTD